MDVPALKLALGSGLTGKEMKGAGLFPIVLSGRGGARKQPQELPTSRSLLALRGWVCN